MTLPQLGSLISQPALTRPDLLAPTTAEAISSLSWADRLAVVEIDPDLADTAAMSAAYDLPMSAGANCVIISGKREGVERLAACVVRADTRADVNNRVKRLLDVRKCSFHPMDRAVSESGMEYGGITPIGLPLGWRLLVDERCLSIQTAVIGSGVRRSKLLISGPDFALLPGVEIVPDLAQEISSPA